jgi:hypothetical protein
MTVASRFSLCVADVVNCLVLTSLKTADVAAVAPIGYCGNAGRAGCGVGTKTDPFTPTAQAVRLLGSSFRGRAIQLASHDSKEFWGVLFCGGILHRDSLYLLRQRVVTSDHTGLGNAV